jgi:hypothetical protein
VLDRHAHRRAADLVEELMGAVRAWADGPLDDLTVVVLKQLARTRAGTPAAAMDGAIGDPGEGPVPRP